MNYAALGAKLDRELAREVRIAPDATLLECLREARRIRSAETCIYFIQADDGPIKIGIAADIEERRYDLQCANAHELFIIAAFKGTAALERVLHKRFSRYRIRGEWFAPAEDVLAFAAELREHEFAKRDFFWDAPVRNQLRVAAALESA